MRPFGLIVVTLGSMACEKVGDEALAPAAFVAPSSPEPIALPRAIPISPLRPVEPRPAARRPLSRATRWFLGLNLEQRRNARELCRVRAGQPCAGLLPLPRGIPDPSQMLLASLGDQAEGVDAYCRQLHPDAARCNTPLVIAFDDQPVVFTSAAFSFSPGAPQATGWPTATTPWIALDRDGDGAITSGRELFGDASLLPDGTTAPDGFAALAALDANGDGVIDRADPAFGRLRLWADRDGDGASRPDELRSLADVVVAIPLAHRRDPRCAASGDCEGERGSVVFRAGGVERTGAVVDVYLRGR